MKPLLLVYAERMQDDLPQLVAKYGDYRALFTQAMGWPDQAVVEVHANRNEPLPDIRQYSGAIITGAAAMVQDDHPWIESLASWVRGCAEQTVPLLGVCFGQQLIAHALGGKVVEREDSREWGSYTISINGEGQQDMLCEGLPLQHIQQQAHHQIVAELPEGAVALAHSPAGIQIARYTSCLWGTQFHPEFHYDFQGELLPAIATHLSERGIDVNDCLATLKPHDEGAHLLQNFAKLLEAQA